ncbi:hypothetical protein D3C78_1558280 [compost metagenome]
MGAQLDLLHLGATRHAYVLEGIDDFHIARHLEIGATAFAPGNQFGRLGLLVFAQEHKGGRYFAQTGIGHPHHLGHAYGGMTMQNLFNLGRRHVLTTNAEHILQPAHHAQTPFGIHLAQVAGAKPAILA